MLCIVNLYSLLLFSTNNNWMFKRQRKLSLCLSVSTVYLIFHHHLSQCLSHIIIPVSCFLSLNQFLRISFLYFWSLQSKPVCLSLVDFVVKLFFLLFTIIRGIMESYVLKYNLLFYVRQSLMYLHFA